ncbi:MAG: mannose-1-phosphate guanylyltransferase/mannose-6-phosphate isomerase [Methylococcaceae bacterium]|nr:mannose-1-phosphate guanylyltransferase/mannose-6-phosphate isomerase [Methylococcaceae bacterium]MDZ4155245.1 mannose-1-phosphate guanylyltransferase/mannose-6-phosphate isomerase [Methylococcales bacterium]MDP2393483.1 mannose-1-phosphate guanylyltransferase/mannose-6-phosphate isomerase [Methylococcaceae bacterium]MDP3021353.1 mannose-1-phosphate guanylyltransferase/mannose-6-phosphate isomerase [Methylococcaceae bacterium]MDP3391056.1 mannose-1-phosphate guanylyltransferase/mannose-6-pho
MIPVILSGGSGTRLWPLSRGQYPKQFLPLVSDNTMLQETLLRLSGLEQLQPPIAVCNEDHRFMLAEQLWEIHSKPAAIILEPIGKNTAPAVALAALSAQSPDDVLLVLPADHVINNIKAFHTAVNQARELAEQGYLVTFGIVPTEPETGYGYIKRASSPQGAAFNVEAFVEKPNLETAKHYLQTGDYFWNSGMFAFKAGVYLAELEKFHPTMLATCKRALSAAKIDLDFVRLNKEIFSTCPSDSIDYAVMEKTDKAVVIPLDADWNDVGSWSALWDVTDKDGSGNAINGDVLTVDTQNSYIHAGSRLVAAIGVRDLVIIETADAVMVAPKDRVQEVKDIVAQLKNLGRKEANIHRKAYRPWGHYDSVDNGERHQTKRIVVKPGARLSLQKHHHRAEHWVVVKGTALVTKGEEKLLISENESIYIPLGIIHCLENPGVIPLEIVEVQSGSYLGEDDIVRIDDSYGRV